MLGEGQGHEGSVGTSAVAHAGCAAWHVHGCWLQLQTLTGKSRPYLVSSYLLSVHTAHHDLAMPHISLTQEKSSRGVLCPVQEAVPLDCSCGLTLKRLWSHTEKAVVSDRKGCAWPTQQS
eukprot:1161298-Pelagomonas_calceolata.AAC.17